MSPLEGVRRSIRTDADAVRWACVLEATAPKPGNVHPGRSFADLDYADFVTASRITADAITESDRTIGERILTAVDEGCRSHRSNVNLGIVLLLTPLVVAGEQSVADGETFEFSLKRVLESIGEYDSRRIFAAIGKSRGGGLKLDDSDNALRAMDACDRDAQHDDLMAAMRLSRDRDQIAAEYATHFNGVLRELTPLLHSQIRDRGDLLLGIATTAVVWLARYPDSLILRKAGREAALEVKRRAGLVDVEDPCSVDDFDVYLRSQGNRLNPGTTADLIAAGLFVLLRQRTAKE